MKLLTPKIIPEEDRLWDRKILRYNPIVVRSGYRWFFEVVDIKLKIEWELIKNRIEASNETTD